MLLAESTLTEQSCGVVVTDKYGRIKDSRFVRQFGPVTFEFAPNRLQLHLINSGHIEPNTWKIPFLFGSWSIRKS